MTQAALKQNARSAAATPVAISIADLTKQFTAPDGGRFVVIDRISLTVGEGQFVSIVGPSGCGKSTLLNVIAGIESCESGSVTVSPRAGHSEPRLAYVCQSARLLNWLTVAGNINFVLEAQNVPREQWPDRVKKYLELV